MIQGTGRLFLLCALCISVVEIYCMEAIKLTKTIQSHTLQIDELEQFQGQTVEIIILALEQASRVKPLTTQKKTAGGMLSKYQNVELWEQESSAWERAVKEKYANR